MKPVPFDIGVLFLLEKGELTDFERSFVGSMRKLARFQDATPKQSAVLRRIIDKYLKTEMPSSSPASSSSSSYRPTDRPK